jgi:hypothetical protein
MFPYVLLVWGNLTNSFIRFAKGDPSYVSADLSMDINQKA